MFYNALLIEFLSTTGQVDSVLIEPKNTQQEIATNDLAEVAPDIGSDFFDIGNKRIYNFSECNVRCFRAKRNTVEVNGQSLRFEWKHENLFVHSGALYLLVMPKNWQISQHKISGLIRSAYCN
jgi:hypothetical protein